MVGPSPRSRIEEGSRLDSFRRLLKLAWDEMYDLDKDLPVSAETSSAVGGTVKDMLMDLGMIWYNPMNRYMWQEELEEFDPGFLEGNPKYHD